ncbi:MAG TPA: dihydroneopterin aldolase [Candidatus Limnocylindria bacterium]
MSDRITLRGMEFMGRHGVNPEEQITPQPFEVDLILRTDLSRPAATDELADTIDYSAAFKVVAEVVEDRSYRLIERLAGAVAEAVLATFPVDDVEVRVRKPKAPMAGAFETVEARLRRRRV